MSQDDTKYYRNYNWQMATVMQECVNYIIIPGAIARCHLKMPPSPPSVKKMNVPPPHHLKIYKYTYGMKRTVVSIVATIAKSLHGLIDVCVK